MNVKQDASLAAGPLSVEGAGGDLLASQPPRRWKKLEVQGDGELPGERSGAASVVYKDAIYVFGGYGGAGRLDDLFRYDIETKRWSKVDAKNPPAGRENNGAVVYNDKMYLFGGYSGFNWLNDFVEFDFETNEWQTIKCSGNPPSTRFGYVSAMSDEGIFFVFGGYDGNTWLNDMNEFDIDTKTWAQTPPMGNVPTGRSCPSWATYQGGVYVFGGYDGVHRMQDFHRFDLRNKGWSKISCNGSVPSPRYFHASVVYGDSLFIFGGYSGQERLKDLYEFRFDLSTWFLVEADNPPSGRSSLVAQVHKHVLFVFGGYNGQNVLNDFYEFRFETVSIPPSSLSEDLRTLFNEKSYADVTFLVEEKEVYGNRAFLAARCEHFRALFFSGMRESRCLQMAASRREREREKEVATEKESETELVQGPPPVPIEDVTHQTFLLMLEYLYTDKLPHGVTIEDAVLLLVAAERFMLDRLKAICQEIIRKGIKVDNSLQVLRLAYEHRADGLREICIDFIERHEREIKRKPERLEELVHMPEVLLELYKRRPVAGTED